MEIINAAADINRGYYLNYKIYFIEKYTAKISFKIYFNLQFTKAMFRVNFVWKFSIQLQRKTFTF